MNQINTLVLNNLSPAQLAAVAVALMVDDKKVTLPTYTENPEQESCAEPSCSECVAPCDNDISTMSMTPLDDLLAVLNDERFEYRTLTALENVVTDPLELLEDHGYRYETKRRRSDGEILVKLLKVVSTQAAQPAVANQFEQLMDLLNHPDYKWRTFDTLYTKLDLTADEVQQLLEDNNVDYVTGNRASDNKEIIALSSRV